MLTLDLERSVIALVAFCDFQTRHYSLCHHLVGSGLVSEISKFDFLHATTRILRRGLGHVTKGPKTSIVS